MSVLEISELGCHLATFRGFITLSINGEEIHRLPFDHVSAIITKAHGITYTQNLLIELAKHNIPVVITDQAFMPVSMILPIGVHHAAAKHLNAQVNATKSQKNILWQLLIKRKIGFQAALLSQLNIDHNLNTMIPNVNRGDTRNIEAQAARSYWTLLFGPTFRRDRHGNSPNDMLNYGYTILRSAIARQVCATGLHPAIGICHKHPLNTFCLVDDLIEPYRPLVDYAVYHCLEKRAHELNKKTKTLLASLLEQHLPVGTQWLTVADSIKILAQSLSHAYLNNNNALKLPKVNLTKIHLQLE